MGRAEIPLTSQTGGTWHVNRYPGAACDIASHSYQFSFNPKPDWSALYAPSHEIREYIEQTAKKYGVDRFVRLQHEVTECTWDQEKGKWLVRVKKPGGEVFEDSCDVLISAKGLLSNKQWPDIPGLDTFKGEVMHSASWNARYDFENKRVGIIGSGSSAIQIVPNLQKVSGTQLNCFMRSRTWISPPFAQTSADQLGLIEGFRFREDQIERFRKDPEAWMSFRMQIEADANNIHALTLKGTEKQVAAQEEFTQGMKSRLAKRPEYYDWIKPNFAPGCRRLTPGPGFLEALVEENVSFIRDKILRIEEGGVVTEGETLHEIDVLVCATGFYASAAPPFKVSGVNGHTLQDHWHDRAYNYLSLATDQFPNHFMMLGPNGAIGEGSLTMMIESTGDYIVKAVRKIQRDNIKSMSIKSKLVRDFTRYCDAYFEGTVYKDDCQSCESLHRAFMPLTTNTDKITRVPKKRTGQTLQTRYWSLARQHPPLHRSAPEPSLGRLRVRIPVRRERGGDQRDGVVGQWLGDQSTQEPRGRGGDGVLSVAHVPGTRSGGSDTSQTGGECAVCVEALVVLSVKGGRVSVLS